MTNVEKRVSDLEASAGGNDGCERCGDTTIVMVNRQVYSVSKRGNKFPHAAAVAFVAEEEPGRVCPACGTLRREVANIGRAIRSR